MIRFEYERMREVLKLSIRGDHYKSIFAVEQKSLLMALHIYREDRQVNGKNGHSLAVMAA